MEKDLNQNAAEFNGNCEDDQPEIGEHPTENSRDATEAGSCPPILESGEQSNAVVSNGSESKVNVDNHATPMQTEDVNQAAAVKNGGDAGSDDTLPAPGTQEDRSGDFVMVGDKEASTESCVTPDAIHVLPGHVDSDSDGVPSSDAVADDFSELRKRKESLQRLCDVLMEERDQATQKLREKDDEVFRLRKRIVETEVEKTSLKQQLAEALGRSVLAEKKVVSVQEENARLQAEITRLSKRVGELENSDLQSERQQAPTTNGEYKTPRDTETVTLSHAEELQEQPASGSNVAGAEDKSQEIPNFIRKESEVTDGPKRAGAKDHESDSSSQVVVRRRDRAAKRSESNFYRHSFAGSLPRPFHSYELPRQGSDAPRYERSGSFNSDTSDESQSSEGGSHSVPGIPSFMRRPDKPAFLKSGYSPVQFNFQPLPESITHRRVSWDATRHTRPRGGSMSKARDSSDSKSSGSGSLTGGQKGNELKSAPDHLDGGQEKSSEEVETEKYSKTVQVSSTDCQSNAENLRNSKDLISATTSSAEESRPSFVIIQNHEEKVDSSDQPQVQPEEDEKRESVSELIDIWSKRTTEVIDV